MNDRCFVTALLAMAALCSFGCSSKRATVQVDGEPVCADFKVGGELFTGGLEQPVIVAAKDGDDVVARGLVRGRRSPQDPPPHIFLPKHDAEYAIEWGQCANRRAPQPASGAVSGKDSTTYECGELTIYDRRTFRAGSERASLPFVAPPHPDCWTAPAPPPAAPPEPPSQPPSIEPSPPEPAAGPPDASAPAH